MSCLLPTGLRVLREGSVPLSFHVQAAHLLPVHFSVQMVEKRLRPDKMERRRLVRLLNCLHFVPVHTSPFSVLHKWCVSDVPSKAVPT